MCQGFGVRTQYIGIVQIQPFRGLVVHIDNKDYFILNISM